jgi:muramoyltetrapeptide carboxypeptidase LdcA involved in peptidoglycan recycling
MLSTVLHSSDFRGIVGIAVGQLVGSDPANGRYTALELLDKTWGPLGIPVLTGLPIGHDASTAMPLVLGAVGEISFGEGATMGVLKVEIPRTA